MPFEDIYLVTDRLNLVPPDELDSLERRLGFPLPFGYREYLSTLGIGKCCRGLEVQTPDQIEPELEYWQREFIPIAAEEGFWEDSLLLTPKELAETVVFAKNSQGDSFVCCPSKGQVVFELPRHESRMRLLPHGFLQPFDCVYGARERFRFPFFEAKNDRRRSAQLILKARAKPSEVWKAVQDQWGGAMRIVEGDVTTKERTTAFINTIRGAVILEGGTDTPWFYFEYDIDHKQEVHAVLKRLEHLVKTRGGDWPAD